MKQRTWRVSADVPSQTRALILRMHKPRFSDVFVRTITWAYGVEESYPFDSGVKTCVLTGLHRGHDTEAFALRLDGESMWPDRPMQPLFLALSCASGVPPFSAGAFGPHDVQPIDPITFAVQLALNPNFKVAPRKAA